MRSVPSPHLERLRTLAARFVSPYPDGCPIRRDCQSIHVKARLSGPSAPGYDRAVPHAYGSFGPGPSEQRRPPRGRRTPTRGAWWTGKSPNEVDVYRAAVDWPRGLLGRLVGAKRIPRLVIISTAVRRHSASPGLDNVFRHPTGAAGNTSSRRSGMVLATGKRGRARAPAPCGNR
jgi:hypothetical protein